MNLTVKNQTSLEDFEEFDLRDAINVVVYGFMSLVGMALNGLALVIAAKQSARPQAGGRTNVHYLVFHLTLADSIICYVVLPLETLWRLTIEWHAGNLACKILMMFRTGGFILSSAILVVISIDRLMVAGSWIFTLLSAAPQAVIFRVLKHPTKEFYQCTTIDFFEDLAEKHFDLKTNQTEYILGGINTEAWHTIYHTVINTQIFFLPLLVIIISYIKIYSILAMRNENFTNLQTPRADAAAEENPFNSTQIRSSRRDRSNKGMMKALKMSIIHVLTFLVLWTPYTLIQTWQNVHPESIAKVEVPGLVFDILYLTAVLNSCVNPLIYGFYFYIENRSGNMRANTRLNTQPRRTCPMTSLRLAQDSFIDGTFSSVF